AFRGLRPRGPARRPGADVPRGPLHDPREPRGLAGPVDSVWLRRQGTTRGNAGHLQLFRRGADARTRPSFPCRHGLAHAHAAGFRMNWEIVIGLETHAQLSTTSKIFSGASTAFGAPPNAQASAVDLALPGVLPVLNKGAVERAIRFGLAVEGR